MYLGVLSGVLAIWSVLYWDIPDGQVLKFRALFLDGKRRIINEEVYELLLPLVFLFKQFIPPYTFNIVLCEELATKSLSIC